MYKYDHTNPLSIEEYGKQMIGLTFGEILSMADNGAASDVVEYGNVSRKGGLGNLIEERFFGYKANSESEPDFKEAGVELKATPYERKRNGELRAGERLVLTMIANDKPVDKEFHSSHLWHKCKLILLVYYLRDKSLGSNMLYSVDYVKLFTPTAVDLAIIEQDYKDIIEKIQDGKAHELSEGDTIYLGACTKGSTAEKSTVPQFYPPHIPARRRAFCYKNSYMTHVLNDYIVKDITTYEPDESIITDAAVLADKTFQQYIIDKISQHAGKTDKQLCEQFDREYNNNKAQWVDIAYRMLGIRSNRAEEFVKANIVVKAIRLEKNGKMTENSPLPPFKYKELIAENWEDSTLCNYFEETKFLFVVYKSNGSEYVLKGCQFWNMPYEDFETVHEGWQKIVDVIREGVVFTPTQTKSGIVIKNNFPKKADNKIIHIRPHASKRYFKFDDGTILGDGNESHANELPDGRWMPNHSFWMNNDYIVSQIKEELK